MNMPSLYHFVVLYIFRLVLVSSTAFCYEPYQCTNETVTDNFTVHAYKGAYGAQTSLIGYGDCNGAHSCQLVQLIQTEYFKLWCSGAYSCSNTTILIINGDIWCSAVHSCSFTHFLGGDPDLTFVWTDLRCEGYFSCAYALIEDIPVVYAGGSYALYKAVIDTTRAQNLAGNFRFYFYGEYSGYGAKIICAHPGYQHCTIHCYSTGCHMLFLDCIADCTIYTYPSATAILPLHIANISQYVRPNHSLFEVNNDENCAIYNTTFDSYQERNQGADIVSDTPICCRGDESCSNVNLITTKANVICSGSYACAYSLIDMRTSNGSVFCEADNSCRSSQIDGAADLHCMAGASCDSSMISNIDRVLCAADYSCENATIVSSGRDLNVYFGGYKSGNATKIYCDANDSCLIVCAAYFACYQTMFICERNANCTVQCDPQTPDYCPLIRNINTTTEHPSQTMLNTSTTPTEYPSQATNIPSIFPTDHPLQTTVAPTYIPKTTTTAPTEDPLQSIPSASPTNHALQTTFHPSLNPSDIFSSAPSISDRSREVPDAAISTEISPEYTDDEGGGHKSPLMTIIVVVAALCCTFAIVIFIYKRKQLSDLHEPKDSKQSENMEQKEQSAIDSVEPDVDVFVKPNQRVYTDDDGQILAEWLAETVHLPQYFGLLVQNEHKTMESIKAITEANIFEDIGITNKAHVRKLLNEITRLQDNNEDETMEGQQMTIEGQQMTEVILMKHQKDEEESDEEDSDDIYVMSSSPKSASNECTTDGFDKTNTTS
eukprot:450256_1